MFLSFVLRLVGGSVLPIFLLSILEMPLIGLVSLTLAQRDPTAGWWNRVEQTVNRPSLGIRQENARSVDTAPDAGADRGQ